MKTNEFQTLLYINIYAFQCGLLEKEVFSAFIDGVLAAEEKPPWEFAEAALRFSGETVDTVSPLKEYLNGFKPESKAFSEGILRIIRDAYLNGCDYETLARKAAVLLHIQPEFEEIAEAALFNLAYNIANTAEEEREGAYEPGSAKNWFEELIGVREPSEKKENTPEKIPLRTLLYMHIKNIRK